MLYMHVCICNNKKRESMYMRMHACMCACVYVRMCALCALIVKLKFHWGNK